MPSPLFLAVDNSRLVKVGRAGYDSGFNDTATGSSASYTAVLRSGRISPAGESGLCLFRRVAIRVFHADAFTATIRVYVDGKQTERPKKPSELSPGEEPVKGKVPTVPQSIVVNAQSSGDWKESVLLADIEAVGSYCEVELEIASSSLKSPVLIESALVHYRDLGVRVRNKEDANPA